MSVSLDLFATPSSPAWEDAGVSLEHINDSKIEVREIKCASLLHTMNYGRSTEYTANLYRGCTHGCVYCYAPSLIHDERRWGAYVDAKINAPQVIDRELRRAKKQVVVISSASDPYQSVEARYKITRKTLKVLLRHDFPVLLLTRSPLILRDLDLLIQFKWLRVGFSITSVSTKFYEPGVPSLDKRLEALKKLHDRGITTWVSMAPIIPQLILEDMDALFQKIKNAGVDTITLGILRFTGYEESRIMFEERTGKSAHEVMQSGQEVREQLKEKAHSYRLDTSGACLSWTEDVTVRSTLDHFSG
ncbi:MAG: radical SAM protein [Nitrososphaerales archaeon]